MFDFFYSENFVLIYMYIYIFYLFVFFLFGNMVQCFQYLGIVFCIILKTMSNYFYKEKNIKKNFLKRISIIIILKEKKKKLE